MRDWAHTICWVLIFQWGVTDQQRYVEKHKPEIWGVFKYHIVSESRSTAIYEKVLLMLCGYFLDFHQNIRNEGLGGYQCATWGSEK